MTQQEYIDSIKAAFLDVGKRLVMDQAVKSIPILGSAILNPIASLIIGKVIQVLVDQAELQAFFIYVDFRVNQQGQDFVDLLEKYNKMSKEERLANEKALIDSFRSLVRLTN